MAKEAAELAYKLFTQKVEELSEAEAKDLFTGLVNTISLVTNWTDMLAYAREACLYPEDAERVDKVKAFMDDLMDRVTKSVGSN